MTENRPGADHSQTTSPTEMPQTEQHLTSIAVLPFANLSADPEQEYFCDGVADEIAAELSKIQALRITSRNSTMRMKGTQKNIQAIGRELGVIYVLKGSIRKVGTRLRIAVHFIDTNKDYQLWAEEFDGSIADVFDFQEKVARSVVQALSMRLSPEENRRMGVPPIDDVQAYECYLKAQSLFLRTPDPNSLAQALQLLDGGIAILNDNDRLYATKGLVYMQLIKSLSVPPEAFAGLLERAQWCATKALSINYDSSAAQFLQASIFMQKRKPRNAIKRLQKAIALGPSNAGAAVVLGFLLAAGGTSMESARELLEMSAELDPLTPATRAAPSYLHLFQGNFPAAIAALRESHLDLEATKSPFIIIALWLQALGGNYDEVDRLADSMTHNLPGHVMTALASFYKHALCGSKEQALSAVTPQVEEAARWNEVYSLMMAEGYAIVREYDAAFRWLECAIDYGIKNVAFLSQHDGLLANLRPDVRFSALIEKADSTSMAGSTTAEIETELWQIFSTQPLGQRPAPTVGREQEHAALHSAFDEVAGGRGLLLAIGGEPGLGKTTLVEEFVADLQDADAVCTIARGCCSERLAEIEPYLPILEALDDLLRGDTAGTLGELMLRVAPAWHALVAPPKEDNSYEVSLPADAETAPHEHLKREFVELLGEISRRSPLLLLFDDIHWTDASTADLLAYAGERFDKIRCMIVATYQPSEIIRGKHPFATLKLELAERGVARDLGLGLLSLDDIRHYLEGEFPDHRFPASLAGLVYAKTEGNPLFTIDLLRYLRDRGVILRRDGRWMLSDSLADVENQIPLSVRSLIQEKLDQLGEEDRRLLAAASVQGDVFDSAIVGRALGMRTGEVEEHLNNLERMHPLVRRIKEYRLPSGAMNLRYRFAHVLYRIASYDDLTPSRRASVSRSVAEALEYEYRDHRSEIASNLALLFETAQDYEKAARFFTIAVQHAARRQVNHEMVSLARRGLAATENLPQGPLRTEMELPLRMALGTP